MLQQKHNLSNLLPLPKNEQGFGIIEVVISLFIIGVSLLLFQIVSQTVVLNKYNEYREVALRAAETQIQTLKTTPYESLPSSGSFSNSQISSLPSGSGQFTVNEVADGLSEVEVTITWQNSGQSGNQTISLSSLVSSGGLGK